MSEKVITHKPLATQSVAVTARLSDARVAAYLRRHPHFFDKHPELLAHLQIPHDSGATSLIERQVQQLRKRNEELNEQLQELIAVAGDNGDLFDRIRGVILELLDAQTANQLGTRLHNLLQEPFDYQQIALIRFHANASSPWRSIARKDFDTQLPGLLRSQRALSGKWRRTELRYVFGDEGLSLSSAAIIPLKMNNRAIGVIALGSTEASHFRSSMDTLFISHLGDVVARLLTRCERLNPAAGTNE
ncbi:MAG: DUF484 family protein [Moraxellaceae bacterium]|nr:DUF484 family protein [Moraxellaceae bacterium]